MKTIKIIDLLYKIENGEEVPKKIHFDDYDWKYIPELKDYVRVYKDDPKKNPYLFDWYLAETGFERFRNHIAEIIEEDKEIEKIGNDYYHKTQPEQNQIFQRKINELIDKLNSLENKQ